jgi:DNA-binding NtrC family response regulator
VVEAGGQTAFERTSSSNGGQQLANGRTLPRLYIPEGGTSLEEMEHAMVELAMKQASNNQTHAAKLLDISRDALRYKLKKFGLIRADDEENEASADQAAQG